MNAAGLHNSDAVVEQIIIDQLLSDRMRAKFESGLKPSLSLADDLNADSLDLVEIALQIELAFKIKLPEGIDDAWITVGGIQNTVREILVRTILNSA